jgi:hypothetical protein
MKFEFTGSCMARLTKLGAWGGTDDDRELQLLIHDARVAATQFGSTPPQKIF